MKNRFRLFQHGVRGGTFYCVDSDTGKRESLGTKDLDEASQLILVRNQAVRQPALNLQMAKAFLAASDDDLGKRTWQHAIDSLVDAKHNSTKARWLRSVKHPAFDLIRERLLIETHAEHFLAVLKAGTISTNMHLRQIQNFVLDLNWLPSPIIPRRQWPTVRFRERRAITRSEHEKIVAADPNAERRVFYEVAWHLGASQTDIALLTAENIDWRARIITFDRLKTGQPCVLRFGEDFAAVLEKLPPQGPLFPNFSKLREGHRSTHFKRSCQKSWSQREFPCIRIAMPGRNAPKSPGIRNGLLRKLLATTAKRYIGRMRETHRLSCLHLKRSRNRQRNRTSFPFQRRQTTKQRESTKLANERQPFSQVCRALVRIWFDAID